jgi:hypothetical protein
MVVADFLILHENIRSYGATLLFSLQEGVGEITKDAMKPAAFVT